MIEPFADRVVVERVEEDDVSPGGIIIPEGSKEKPLQGIVKAAGPKAEFVKVEDEVLFSKYAGTEFAVGDVTYLIIREEDILGRLK